MGALATAGGPERGGSPCGDGVRPGGDLITKVICGLTGPIVRVWLEGDRGL